MRDGFKSLVDMTVGKGNSTVLMNLRRLCSFLNLALVIAAALA